MTHHGPSGPEPTRDGGAIETEARRLLLAGLTEQFTPADLAEATLGEVADKMSPWLARLLDETQVAGRAEGAAIQASAVDTAMSDESESILVSGDDGYVTRVDPESIFEAMLEDSASIETHRERWRAEGRAQVAADMQGITDERVADLNHHGIARPTVKQRTDEIARLLIDTYERVEGTKVGVSFIATFADMGRAVVEHIDTRLVGYEMKRGIAHAIHIRRFNTPGGPDSIYAGMNLAERIAKSYLHTPGDPTQEHP